MHCNGAKSCNNILLVNLRDYRSLGGVEFVLIVTHCVYLSAFSLFLSALIVGLMHSLVVYVLSMLSLNGSPILVNVYGTVLQFWQLLFGKSSFTRRNW